MGTSWFGRGIKPASQADGWWDEGFANFHDDGADGALAFDFFAAPVVLCSRDPWQRHTPGNAYADGSRFWRGMAALLGVAPLNALMKDLYAAHQGNPVSTAMIEEFLLCRSGNVQVVDAFHRFVYGLANPSPAPDLWLRDDVADPGADAWGGAFWDSPDLWIRNADDGGTTHQSPEYGQDNWFHARVRNKLGAGVAQHLVVTFHSKGFAGTEFLYPGDFLPCVAARAEFELSPGATRIVKARWPRDLVPAEGSHTCLLAAVLTRSDHPVAGRHVWEHNNLAQKNLTVVDLLPNTFLILPITVSNWQGLSPGEFALEVLRVGESAPFEASLIHSHPEVFTTKVKPKPFRPFGEQPAPPSEPQWLDCGGHLPRPRPESWGRMLTSATPDLIRVRYPQSWEVGFPASGAARLRVSLPPFQQTVVGLKIGVPPDARPGEVIRLHFVQRSLALKRIVGGVAVQIHVVATGELRRPPREKTV